MSGSMPASRELRSRVHKEKCRRTLAQKSTAVNNSPPPCLLSKPAAPGTEDQVAGPARKLAIE